MRIRWIALGVGVAVAALAVALALTVDDDPQEELTKNRLVGTAAPAYELPTLAGGQVSSEDLAGRVVLVNFWNSWCIPCQQEHPALVEFYERHRDDPDFAMVGIVREDTEDAIREYVQEEGVPYPVAFDPGGRAALAFATRGQPETFAVTPDGIVAAVLLSAASTDDLEGMLTAARGL